MDFQGLLDTLFLSRQTPVAGLLSPEEQERLKTQQLIGTGLGIATGLASNWNKGVAGAALGGFTGGVTGRQAPIDAATRNYMTTTELAKMMQDIQKTSLETNLLQQKQTGLRNLIGGTDDPFLQNAYRVDPSSMLTQQAKRNFPAPDFGESLAIKGIGGDINNLTPDQALTILQSKGGLTQQNILDANIKGAELPAVAPAIKKIPMLTPADILRSGRIPQNVSSNQGVSYTPPTEIRLPSLSLTDRTEPVIYSNQGGVPLTQTNVAQQNQPLSPQTKKPTFQEEKVYNNFQNASNQFTSQNPNPIVNQNLQYSPKKVQEYKDKFPEVSTLNTRVLQEYNDAELQIDRLLNHAGFDDLFSAGGDISKATSRQAQAAGIIWNKVKSGGVANTLKQQKLEDPNGATPYGQMNYSELILVKQGFTELPDAGTNPDSARAALLNLKEILNKSRDGILNKHNIIYGSEGTNLFEKRITTNFETDLGTAYLGSVLQGKLYGNKGIKDNYYYIQAPNNTLRLLKNPKTKQPLTKQDVLKQGFDNIYSK
jgi:hypothetical protein